MKAESWLERMAAQFTAVRRILDGGRSYSAAPFRVLVGRAAVLQCFLLCTSTVLTTLAAPQARAQEVATLPDPLLIEDVLRIAHERRAEVAGMRARGRAASQRPAIVSALEDPMLTPSVDFLPFTLEGANVSLTVEQRFPLSRVLGNRGRAAEAEATRVGAEVERVALDVELEAASAFLQLQERRQRVQILNEQRELAGQFVRSAIALYAAGTGVQPEVLRAEIEVARLDGAIRAIAGEVRAAEAMLNTALGRRADGALPELQSAASTVPPPAVELVRQSALERRPELRASQLAIRGSQAQVAVMNSMYAPMAVVRTGPAYMMPMGFGWRLMAGISIPLWRGRLRAGVEEAEATVSMARADLEAMTRRIDGNVVASREQVAAARERFLALRDDVVPRAREAIDPTLAGYAAGQLPLVSVIEAATMLWMAQGELISAEYSLGLAWARLHRAIGDWGNGP